MWRRRPKQHPIATYKHRQEAGAEEAALLVLVRQSRVELSDIYVNDGFGG